MNRLISIIISIFLTLQLFSQSTIAEEYITAKASTQYANPSFFHRILIGTNYREEWETPVRVPVFHLKKMGFKILELGGGMQTKSLKLQDKNGREWALR